MTAPHEEGYLATLTMMGMCASCVTICSPLPSMFKIMRYGVSGKELIGLLVPYFLLFVQYYLWSFYGILSRNPPIARINCLGFTMCGMYLCVMTSYALPKDRAVVQPLVGLLSATIVLASWSVFAAEASARVTYVAYTATFCTCLLNVAPMVQIMEVVRTKSMEGFPVALSSASFLGSLLWSEYSILIHDVAYLFPNLLGVVLNGIQLGVVGWVYFQDLDLEDDETFGPIISGMKEVPEHLSQAKDMLKSIDGYKGISLSVSQRMTKFAKHVNSAF